MQFMIIAIFALGATVSAFTSIPQTRRIIGGSDLHNRIISPSAKLMPVGHNRQVLRVEMVQTIFAAGCALSVFFYVLNNIDEIKLKQKLATEKAMAEQTASIKDAQDVQRRAIEEAQRKQQAEIEKIRRMK